VVSDQKGISNDGSEASHTKDPPFKILVVDDEETILRLLREYLESQGYAVATAAGGQSAVELVQKTAFDLILLDLMMPDLDGLETLREIKRCDKNASVLIMTAYGTIKSAVEAMKIGADDYLIKPLSLEALGLLIQRVRELQNLRQECLYLRKQVAAIGEGRNLVTRNKRMQDILDLVAKVAPLPSTVLIEGESGTGKELIARAIHHQSPRANKRFVAINCGVIPIHLLESELFGYERGAFTGADSRKLGFFEMASGGTLLLDEISEMSMDLQVKLLRVIQERSFLRVGGTEEISTDVRVIASTNRNLEEEVAESRFRKDLYYRINVIRIAVPPLRERTEDISVLSLHFLRKYAGQFGKAVKTIAPGVMELFMHHRWEGNVRELENVIERAVAVTDREEIVYRDLPPEFTRTEPAAVTSAGVKPYQNARQEFEVAYLKSVLSEARGNVTLAARLAEVPRQNLYDKLKKYEVDQEIFR
jgi:two-component system response regulator HydG